ncbi:MAG: DUF5615 family PIN-like protein [Gammaproteobacteria bacterium]
MKFLVDAQLPRRLALRLQTLGHDALHTLDLPLANRTPDVTINALSLREQRIVITKDADFVNSFLLSQKPWKLLFVATGNITNIELEPCFSNVSIRCWNPWPIAILSNWIGRPSPFADEVTRAG